MKFACERCNKIINKYLDKYEITTRKAKPYGDSEFILCENCSKELDNFIYKYQKIQN